MIPFIDVSAWQFPTFNNTTFTLGDGWVAPDFTETKARGVRAVVARATNGLRVDPAFTVCTDASNLAGLVTGAYAYLRPNLSSPEVAAQTFLDAIANAVTVDFTMADCESFEGDYTWGQSALADWFETWLRLVEAGTGKRPAIYTGYWWWQPRIGAEGHRFSAYDFVLAAYPHQWPGGEALWPAVPLDANEWYSWATTTQGGDPGLSYGPTLPEGIPTWGGWQISSWALAADHGFQSGRLDCDVAKPEVFERWAAAVVTEPVPEPTPEPAPEPTKPGKGRGRWWRKG